MQVHVVDAFTRQTTSTLITIYQKHISPLKGFSCAYRVLQGGESCSQYVKRTIVEQGLRQAIPLIQVRFQDCKAANQVLKSKIKAQLQAQEDLEEPESTEDAEQAESPGSARGGSFRKQAVMSQNSGNANSGGDCCDASCQSLDCLTISCDLADCSTVDCGTFDCSVSDCGGADFSGCDVGGCSF